ncbi:MAG: hypothetical protein IID36_02640 [Planctomycetes bacterium]|nr:hypothetical protein [Planctomycetota bacterium]
MTNLGSWGRPAPVLIVACAVWLSAAPNAVGQLLPWDLFTDSLTGVTCDVIHADNTELVLIRPDSGLAPVLWVVRDVDFPVPETFVDADSNVFFFGQPAGFIAFAEDGDGFASLWWLDEFGNVLALDPLLLEPVPTNSRPQDFVAVECDACLFWDLAEPGCVIDDGGVPDPGPGNAGPPVTISFCGIGMLPFLGLTCAALPIIGVVRKRRR